MTIGVIEGAGEVLDARRLRSLVLGARVVQLVSAWPSVR